MNDCPFALPGFLMLYIATVALGCCPVTSALVLATAYISLGGVD